MGDPKFVKKKYSVRILLKTLNKRKQLIMALLVSCGFWLMLIHKLNHDISILSQENPHLFWKALFRYFIANLGGG